MAIRSRLHASNVVRSLVLMVAFFAIHGGLKAQINSDRVMIIGRNALFFEDYVLSIQYFNQVIGAKPYLYEPYYFRGLAKFYLEDYQGAEADCTEAINRNPYVVGHFEVRGLSRINQKNFSGAASDYYRAIELAPEEKGLWYNYALCHVEGHSYDSAMVALDKITQKWPLYARAYAVKADVSMRLGDTLSAEKLLDKSLELDPYEGNAWMTRSALNMQRQEWAKAEDGLTHAITLLPKNSDNYVNRALARFHQNNYRGAMADYDAAIDIAPRNYYAHYNRALLRVQVGDYNRAIDDFDFVLQVDDSDMMALYNRATLYERVGNYRMAIKDYTRIIKQYPNFWTGLENRARCYKRIGEYKKADADEFRILKGQIDKHNGVRMKVTKTRRRSDVDFNEYQKLVVADGEDSERHYSSDYRGKVQDADATSEPQPQFCISWYALRQSDFRRLYYYKGIDELGVALSSRGNKVELHIVGTDSPLGQDQAEEQFAKIANLSAKLDSRSYFQRAISFFLVQDLENSLADLDASVKADSAQFAAYFMRALVRSRQIESSVGEHEASGLDAKIGTAQYKLVVDDLERCIALAPDFAYAYYNRGCVAYNVADYKTAIYYFSKAVEIDSSLAQAYYNRALSRLAIGDRDDAMVDLSRAGELGIYSAYSLIKKNKE